MQMQNYEGSYLGADQIALSGWYGNFLTSMEQINLSYDQGIDILRQIVKNRGTLTTEELMSLGWTEREADGMRDFLLAMYRAGYFDENAVSLNEKEQG